MPPPSSYPPSYAPASLRRIRIACPKEDETYLRETLAAHFPDEYIATGHDGAIAIAVLDVGHVPVEERGCLLEKAQRLAEKAISLHAVVLP